MSALPARVMRRARRAAAPVAIGGAAVVTVIAVGGVAVVVPETVAAKMHGLTALIADGGFAHPAGADIEDLYQRSFTVGPAVTIDLHPAPTRRQHAPGPHPSDEAGPPPPHGWAVTDALAPAHTDPEHLGSSSAAYVAGEGVDGPGEQSAQAEPSSLDVGFEYDLDGNSPSYVFNGVALANSFMAYVDRRLNRRQVDLPVSVDAGGAVVVRDGCQDGCATADGYAHIDRVGHTTRVVFESADLPLTRPLRRYGGPAGARIADAIDPALRTVVDYGYADNDPMTDRAGARRPRLLPTARETRTFADDVSVAVRKGVRSLAEPPDRAVG
ncbi:PE-PPE domain-containing protein [Mycobacterium sp. WMMD1722]|uniref:PE-PPE domain-containing protein n=1 Tax=Mycobacterium sp. WMMD1722 TaxID=3404117 RepID=UPI003BF5B891